ncbi:hypothetical protein ADK88_31385 [Streptomyces sp. NRRL F-2295]|nr:hypothetical protein ADK33_26370 [Streptomyces griseus subsp. rhodochrous]KOU01412.1 hypothetical protein ADK88_31385 [Streptomyces sp. NRRL F-2295]
MMTSSGGRSEQEERSLGAAGEGDDGTAERDARMESLRAQQEIVRDGGLDTDILLDKRRYRRVRSI